MVLENIVLAQSTCTLLWTELEGAISSFVNPSHKSAPPTYTYARHLEHAAWCNRHLANLISESGLSLIIVISAFGLHYTYGQS